MKQQHISARMFFVGTAAAVTGSLVGCGLIPGTGGGGAVTELPAELVVWGDPDPDSDASNPSVRDANNSEDRFVMIGTGGEVQFNIGTVCTVCDVEGSTILVNGEHRMNIRFSNGPDGAGERRPFLVATDGRYIQLVTEGDSITFQEVDVFLEEDDDPSDDLAERIGTFPNPSLGGQSSRTTSRCGIGMVGMMPLTMLGLAVMRLSRGRRP